MYMYVPTGDAIHIPCQWSLTIPLIYMAKKHSKAPTKTGKNKTAS